jgi:hypothetical protein
MDRRVRLTALACQADLNGVFEDDRHLESLTEKLRSGDMGRVREAIRATIEHTVVGAGGTLTLDVKPAGLLGARAAIAHSGCRGSGTTVVRMVRIGRKRWIGRGGAVQRATRRSSPRVSRPTTILR